MDMAAKFTKPWDCKNDYLSHLTRCHLLIRIMDSLLDDQIQHSTLNDALKELDIQIVRYRMRRSICDQVIKLRCYFLRELYMVCDDGQKWPKKYFHWPFITVKCSLSNFWTNCAILCKVGKIRFYVTSLRKWRLLLHVLMVFSKHCGGGDGDKFAYLTTKNSSFARAFFILFISQPFSFFPRHEITCFAVVWMTWAPDDRPHILLTRRPEIIENWLQKRKVSFSDYVLSVADDLLAKAT